MRRYEAETEEVALRHAALVMTLDEEGRNDRVFQPSTNKAKQRCRRGRVL
jgi:hypothetical protein